MSPDQTTPASARVLGLLLLALALGQSALAQDHFKILHAFTGDADGGGLWGSLALDRHGNVYGTTSGGGTNGGGVLFKLSSNLDGTWSETVLHSFPASPDDGFSSTGGLVFDAAGNLYGTTMGGGGAFRYGTVFEMTPGLGGWSESVLYSFGTNDDDGVFPYAGPVVDKSGNVYGTTAPGGAVFEVSPGSGSWNENVLHFFKGSHDGSGAYAGVTLDQAGNLYGVTERGGAFGGGAVYQVAHTPTGWKERVIHSFPSFQTDGVGGQLGYLAIDSQGSLYGVTISGGANTCLSGCGTVYKLTRGPDGHWRETILYNFRRGSSGYGPGGGVILDKSGNLYGTTVYGGSQNCGCGVVYKLTRQPNGKYVYSVLHTFQGFDGAQPDANLVIDGKGNLYGTTATGGAGGVGVVFEVTP